MSLIIVGKNPLAANTFPAAVRISSRCAKYSLSLVLILPVSIPFPFDEY